MQPVLALLGLAGLALATGDHYPPHPPIGVTKTIEVTYTSLCPYTSTISKPGTTYLSTYYETSTVYTKIPTVIYETAKGPDVTKSVGELAYTTLTKLFPVTETKTIDGSTICITWTSTSTVKTALPTTFYATAQKPDVTNTASKIEYKTETELVPLTITRTVGGSTICETITSTRIIKTAVPTTVSHYVTLETTRYVKTEIETTTTCPITSYTTIIQGKETCITETATRTIKLTKAHTITEVHPVTITKTREHVVTEETTCTDSTLTHRPTVEVTVGTTLTTKKGKPCHDCAITEPTTRTKTPHGCDSCAEPTDTSKKGSYPTTSLPHTTPVPVVTAGAVANNAPAIALVGGFIAAVALI